MSNLVIVAIPDENDRVWKISSEKKPHLTVLFLGDADGITNPEQIVQFVEHAANNTLCRFYLPVDRRGELGEDKADVLFFKKGRYDYKAIRDFRSNLLKDSNIKTAYDSSPQFDGPWQPHLTLGYPETPANSESDNYSSIYDVCFNKIGVWFGDYEGPEFLLKDYWDEWETMENAPVDISMSALTHAVRVSDTPWSNFKDSDYTDEQYARACLLDRGENAGEGKQRYGLPVREPDGTLNRNACHAAAAVLSSKGGTGSARGNKLKATPEQMAKAKNKLVALYNGPLNEDVPEGLGGEKNSMAQEVALGEEFLAHYGKKGMKWGVRKEAVRGGGPGAHIRISNKTNQATVSGRNIAAVVTLGTVVPPLLPAVFLSSRYRAEFKAASKQNQKVQGDRKFKKAIEKSKKASQVHNAAAKEINAKIPAFNNDKRWKGIDLTKNPAKQKEYDLAVEKELLNPEYAKAAVKIYGSESPTGRYRFEIHDASTATLKFRDVLKENRDKRMEHADGDDEEVVVSFTIDRDSMGHILGFQHNDTENSMAQTSTLGEEFLEHYGVKGMHWGVRKETVTGAAKATGRAAKATGGKIGKAAGATSRFVRDVQFENRASDTTTREAVINKSLKPFKSEDLPVIKSRHGDYGKLKNRAKKPFSKEARAYRKDVKEAYIKRLEKTANSMTNASGNRQYTIRERGIDQPAEGGALPTSKLFWDISVRDVKHADSEEFTRLEVIFDDEGYIVDLKPIEVETSMAQTASLGAAFLAHAGLSVADDILSEGEMFILEHYGVKGMHWGVRNASRSTPSAVSPSATSHVPSGAKRKTKIKVAGGENHPASDDALKVAVSTTKLKKSGVKALSNQELREVAQRLQLEGQVKQLTASGSQKFVKSFLKNQGQQTAQYLTQRELKKVTG